MKKPKTQRTKKKKPAHPPGRRARKPKKVATQRAGSNPKVISATRQPKLKAPGTAAVPRPRSTAAVPRPELEAIPTRPLFDAPRHSYFLGGGVAMPAGFLPDGFVLASKRKPAGYRAAEFRSYRTFPEGEFLRCVRYELKPGCVGEMREPVRDLKGEDMAHIPKGKFFIQNGNDGPVLSVHCVCNSYLVRIGKRGSAACSKCGAVYVAPTDRTGLPIVNSQGMKETFFPSALPRERTR
jgi:hypothetical protein